MTYVELSFALDPSGKVYVLKYFDDDGSSPSFPGFANVKHSVIAFDEQTGSQLFTVPLATAWYDSQFHPGLLSVLPDGKLYLPVASAPDPTNPNSGSPVVFSVFQIDPADGSSVRINVDVPAAQAQCSSGGSFAHEVVPDNAGGFLVTNDCYAGVFVSHFDSSGAPLGTAVTLPLSELLSYPWDNTGDAVLSENYLFVQGENRIVGMNLASSAIDLEYACTSECRIVSATDGDQVVVLQGSDGAGSVALTPQPGGSGSAVAWAINAPPGTTLSDYDYSPFRTVFPNGLSSTEQFYAMFPSTGQSTSTMSLSPRPHVDLSGPLGGSIVVTAILSPQILWAQPSRRATRSNDDDGRPARLFDALRLALPVALSALGNPACSSVFNTDPTRPHTYGPGIVLQAMVFGIQVGVPPPADPIRVPRVLVSVVKEGRISISTVAITSPGPDWVPTGAYVVASTASIILQANQMGSVYYLRTSQENALTLIHELGHVFAIVRTLGGSRIVYDADPITREPDPVKEEANRQALAGCHRAIYH